ncbi:MAG: spermidine synthase [bacterium]|nr:spermidine synthase [bacterium]
MAKQWIKIESVETDDGTLELRKRGEKDFLITIAGRVLMNSLSNRSEVILSQLALAALGRKKSPRALIGGLGMGCTLRAALDCLPKDAKIIVAELNPVVVKWCEGELAGLNGKAVSDPRVSIEIDDVASVIMKAVTKGEDEKFDCIILDLYEGPFEAGKEKGEPFYGAVALDLTEAALNKGGVFAIWSEDPDKAFEKRLVSAGFSFETARPGRGGLRHMVYVAKKPAGVKYRGRSSGPGGKGSAGKRRGGRK